MLRGLPTLSPSLAPADPSRLPPADQARAHLFAIFPGELAAGEWYELRMLDCSTRPARTGPREFHRSIHDLVVAAMRHCDRWDVFFGVGLRRCPATNDIRRCPHRQRGTDHVSRLPAAWIDIDVATAASAKPYDSLEEGLARVRQVEPPPGVIVASGGGLHAYWPLSRPTSELERVASLNRAIRDRLGGDNAVDAARILRLAGTCNYKTGEPRPVRLLEVRR
jgi:hypothetical protein